MLTTTLALAALSFSPGANEPGIAWYDGSHADAIAEARAQEKLLLTYFWANTENCGRLYGETMSEDAVIAEMSDMVCYSASAGDDNGRALFEEYGIETVPALLVIGPDGPEEILLGFLDPGSFVAEFQRVKRGENTISSLRAQIAGEHEDLEQELEQRAMLSEKLRNVGAREEGDEVFASILAKDAKGSTYTGAMAIVDGALREISEAGGEDVTKWNLKPLAKVAARIENPYGNFSARCTLAGWQIETGDRSGGLKTYGMAWKKRPADDRVIDGGFGIVERLCHLEQPTSKERKLALEVAEDLVVLVDERVIEPCGACAESEEESEGCCGEGGDDGMKPYAIYQVARVQALNGDTEDAISSMERCVELRPEEETYVSFLENLKSDGRS